MGLFSRNFNKPGPGVRPDEPRKKGAARVWEVFSRDGWPIFKAGLLAYLSALPFQYGMMIAVETHVILYMVLAGVVGGLLAAPQLVGLADTLLRAFRDEPGYWWQTYKKAWKRNVRASLVPGVVFGLIFASQIFTLYHMDTLGSGILMWVVFFMGLLLSFGLSTFVWPQIALVDLPLTGLLKNMILLFLGYLPRALGATAFQVVYWALILLFYPLTTLLLPLTGVWLPMFLSLFVVYPTLDKAFDIETQIKKLRETQLNNTPAPTEKSEEQNSEK